MIGSDWFLGVKLFLLICVLTQLYTVGYARLPDKCIAEDGRQGVCVVKRYCREATQHELLPCEGDYEKHCCPIPTTHRSAQQPRHPVERPRIDDRPKPKDNLPTRDRDDRLNKTPPPENKRSPTRPNNERPHKPPIVEQPDRYDRENRRPRPTQANAQEIPQNRPRPPIPQNPEFSRTTSPPRKVENNPRVSPPTLDDFDKAPIKFPEPNRPKVPACGVKPYELFIAGGEESREHEWPWMTAIFRRYPDTRAKTFLCGGSLINTRYVLTAAHCFVNNYVILPASSFVVRLGSHFLDSGEEYTVSNLIVHHNHSGSEFFNDIALIRLASEVYVTDKIAPICLPSPDMMRSNFVGDWATVAGWGDTAFRSGGSRVLQHVEVPIVTGEECSASYSRVRGAAFLAKGSDHIICAGLRTGGKDACLGDSGGPLMIKMSDDRWIIVGIVSLGYKCAEPGYPGVYTRVTHYMSWIGTNMKKY